MRKLNTEKAAKLGDLLFRYMRARHRFKEKAEDVFDAIIKKKYRAIPFFDPQLVAAWRHYVIGDGPMPRRPTPRHTSSVAGTELPNSPAIAENQSDDLDLKKARCAWSNASGCNSNLTRRI